MFGRLKRRIEWLEDEVDNLKELERVNTEYTNRLAKRVAVLEESVKAQSIGIIVDSLAFKKLNDLSDINSQIVELKESIQLLEETLTEQFIQDNIT